MFDHSGVHPAHVNLGVPSNSEPQLPLDYIRETVVKNNEDMSRSAVISQSERIKQAVEVDQTILQPTFVCGDRVFSIGLYGESDGPDSKLINPSRGPYTVRAKLS